MRLNTRNFSLYLLLLSFVVVGISLTALSKLEVNNQVGTVLLGVSYPLNEYEVVSQTTPPLDRAARLAVLREKIAALPPLLPSSSSTEVAEEAAPLEEVTNPNPTLTLCPGYRSIAENWPPGTVAFAMIEGARVLQSAVADPLNPLLEIKQVYLQLPVQTSAETIVSCVPYDAVGVALDGSLIRNNERDLYAVFGAETLIGYALDGFPIYGLSTGKTDECGGVVTEGQYRYTLSSDRETVLYCFSGNPISW